MFKHILVPVDDSSLSFKAVTYAAKMAKASKGRITVLHVIPPFATPMYADGFILPSEVSSPEQYTKETLRFAQKLFAKAHKATLRAGEVTSHGVTIVDDQPWRAIIATARKRRCDVIVMASHGRRGIGAVLIGSETTRVLVHCTVPVLVVK